MPLLSTLNVEAENKERGNIILKEEITAKKVKDSGLTVNWKIELEFLEKKLFVFPDYSQSRSFNK